MNRELFDKIVNELQDHDIENVVPFFRGEPLLHPDFLEMIQFLREKTAAKIQLATNALLLSPSVSRGLLDLRIDFISFSLDALTKETYGKVRPGGDFARVMANIGYFLSIREKRDMSGTTVQVSATESPGNRSEIPSFIAHWKERVDRVRIYPRHSEGGHYGRLAQTESRRPASVRLPCRKPFTDMVIYADGQVALCNHDWNRKEKKTIGSVEINSIEALWKSPIYENIRSRHSSCRWMELDPCRDCDHWQGNDKMESFVGLLIESVNRNRQSSTANRHQ